MPAVLSRLSVAAALCAAIGAALCTTALGKEIPSLEYYASYQPYYSGRFADAAEAFRDAFALKGVNGRWVDAIPQYTMMGECHYQLGNYDQALDGYAAAMQLYLAFPDFLLRVDWVTGGPKAARTPVRIPWGPSDAIERGVIIGDYPASERLVTGNVINGGKVMIDTRTIKAVNVLEIIRTLAIAIRRYGEIKGPAAKHDRLLNDVITRLASPSTKAGHWSQCLVDVLQGVATRAAGRGGAEGFLRRGRLAAGEYEHPLTAIVLLELAHVALAEGKYDVAGAEFEKATYAAMHFSDRNSPCRQGTPDLLEEAFRYGFIAHRLAGHGKPFTLAKPAADWARQKGCTVLQASLLLDLAESEAGLRNPGGAEGHLKVARQLLFGKLKNDAGKSRVGARLNQLEALVRYQQGRVADGDAALTSAMDFQSRGSLWLYQIRLIDHLVTKPPPGLSNQDRLDLYAKVLRDPDRTDWKVQPLEALSVLMGGSIRGVPMERWFEAVLQSNRAGGTSAVEIADLVRRHRLGTAMDMGGRVVSLRWLLESPPEALDQAAAKERVDLLRDYPDYDKLAKQVQQVKADLRRAPLVVDPKTDRPAADEQTRKLAEVARLSAMQEALLRQIGVDRVYAPVMFPPQRSTKEVQALLGKGQAVLVFFATTANAETPSQFYVFLLMSDKDKDKEKDKYPSWKVAQGVAGFNDATQKLLREMGHFARDSELRPAQLQSTAWQARAADIYKQIFTAAPSSGASSGGASSAIPPGIEELVIVPDSVLWYLPFEALQVPAGGDKMQSLIDKYRLRYAPTMSLAVPDGLGRKIGGNLAVSVGQLMPGKGHDQRAAAAFTELQRVVPSAVALPSPLPERSSIYSTLFDRLLVLDDIDTSAGPLAWRPVRPRLKPEATASPLAGWIELPWGGPDQVILPGFHTPAEHGLNDKEKNPAGMDVFVSTCGLMAAGSRTVLLSRWRTGGKTSFDLVREFAQELPQTTAAHAWQRSVMLCKEAPLVPDQEPRVSLGSGTGAMNGSHPFFWSGYLLMDTGVGPPSDSAAPPKPAAIRAANFR